MGSLAHTLSFGWLTWLCAAALGVGLLIGLKYRTPMLLGASLATVLLAVACANVAGDGLAGSVVGAIVSAAALQVGYLIAAALAELRVGGTRRDAQKYRRPAPCHSANAD